MALYEVLTYGQCNKSVGGSGSVHRDLGREPEGRQLKSLCGSKYGVWTGEQSTLISQLKLNLLLLTTVHGVRHAPSLESSRVSPQKLWTGASAKHNLAT